jgi:hypothetical protein
VMVLKASVNNSRCRSSASGDLSGWSAAVSGPQVKRFGQLEIDNVEA